MRTARRRTAMRRRARGRDGGVREELAPRGAVRATGPPLKNPRAVSNPIQTRTHDRIRLSDTGRPSSSTPDFERPRALAYLAGKYDAYGPEYGALPRASGRGPRYV
jgi:hypothetical protein